MIKVYWVFGQGWMVTDHLLALFADGGVWRLSGKFVCGKVAGEQVGWEQMGAE